MNTASTQIVMASGHRMEILNATELAPGDTITVTSGSAMEFGIVVRPGCSDTSQAMRDLADLLHSVVCRERLELDDRRWLAEANKRRATCAAGTRVHRARPGRRWPIHVTNQVRRQQKRRAFVQQLRGAAA